MSTIEGLIQAWNGRPIAGCPGRFVLRGGASGLRPEALVPSAGAASRFQVAGAPDEVFVVPLAGGEGLISYAKPDGSFVHTANTADGFARKLAALGIKLPS